MGLLCGITGTLKQRRKCLSAFPLQNPYVPLLLIVLLISCIFDSDKKNSEFYGYVKDLQGNPVSGAEIQMAFTFQVKSQKVSRAGAVAAVTTITFDFETAQKVTVRVYDPLGGLAGTPVSDSLFDAGQHIVPVPIPSPTMPGWYRIMASNNDSTLLSTSRFLLDGVATHSDSVGRFVIPPKLYDPVGTKIGWYDFGTGIWDSLIISDSVDINAFSVIADTGKSSVIKRYRIDRGSPVNFGDLVLTN